MILQFDSKQDIQLETVKAITDIFEEQPLGNNDQLKANAVLQMRDNKIDFRTI